MFKHWPCMICLMLLSVACDRNHRYQSSFRSLERQGGAPEGTVPLQRPEVVDKKETLESLQRGQALYARYCLACHGVQGDGESLLSQRGMLKPENFHGEKLRLLSREQIVKIVLHGKERMPPMNRKLSENDAYQVASFVKALQLSRRMPVQQLDRSDREKLP